MIVPKDLIHLLILPFNGTRAEVGATICYHVGRMWDCLQDEMERTMFLERDEPMGCLV
jgi:hypothetical protein